MLEIIPYTKIQNKPEEASILEEIKYIFYISSSLKEFSSEERKLAFFKRWCGDYLTHYPDKFFLMRENNKLMGYLSGCSDSLAALNVLEVPGYQVFSDLFLEFPAHLHINFHPDSRGKGLGSQLINHYQNILSLAHISGFHLVTSPDATNVPFYQRLGFRTEIKREFNQTKLLFMGKKLD